MFTILDLGKELKKRENFDKDEYITKLEKEVARFIRNADLHVINHRKMYEELKATKRALWLARASWNHRVVVVAERDLNICKPNTRLYSVCKLILDKWQWAERKCREYAERFK